MARKLAFMVWLAWLATPSSVFGLGLGGITLNSALNQPLDAEIELLSVEPQDVESLVATIAPAEMFMRYGLDRPAYLSTVSLAVEQLPGGRYVIKATSSRSITEPFVTILIELDWARGRLFREYTVLLDPPVFSSPTSQATPAPVAPTPRSSTTTSGTVLRTPAPQPTQQSTQRTAPAPTTQSGLQAAPLAGEYWVQRNDTLWEIAQRTRPTGADINQTMIALYRANPSAFYGNINRLKAGVILRIPDSGEVASLNRTETRAEVRRQMNEWRGAADSGAESGRLRLVPADDTVSGGAGTSDIDQRIAQDLADQTTENLQLQSQVEDLAKQLDEQQRLIQLKDDQLADLQAQLQSMGADDDAAPVDDGAIADDLIGDAQTGELPADDTLLVDDGTGPDVVIDDEVVVDDTDAVVTPRPAVVGTQAQEPSIVERLTEMAGNQWLWIGVGVVLLGLGGMVFARRRREASEISSNLEALVADKPFGGEKSSTGTARMPAMRTEEDDGILVEESIDDDFETTIVEDEEIVRDLESTLPGVKADGLDQTISGETAVNLENADPFAEADFHMAYGLFDQAAELLENALAEEPARRDLQLKLAGVYFAWGNQGKFLQAAKDFRDSSGDTDSSEWNEILIMGQQLCPDNDLFSGTASGGEIDLELQETAIMSEANVDMFMGDDPTTETGSHKIELDEVFAAADAQNAKDGGETDFDLGAESLETDVIEQGDDLLAGSDLLDGDDDDLLDLDLSGLDALDDDDGKSPTIVEKVDERIEATRATEMDPGATAELNVDDLGLGQELDSTGTIEMPEGVASKTDVGATARIKTDDLDLEGTIEEEIGKTSEMPTISSPAAGDASTGDEVDDGQLFSDVFGDESEGRISDDVDLNIGDSPSADIEQTGTQPLAAVDDLDLNVGEDDDEGDGPTMEVTREMQAVDGGDDYTGTMKLPDSTDATGTHETPALDDDFTGTIKLPEPDADAETMSEVGTKLDLARAYMDMGDPDGAKSILEEVLEEGTDAQKSEANKLLESLP